MTQIFYFLATVFSYAAFMMTSNKISTRVSAELYAFVVLFSGAVFSLFYILKHHYSGSKTILLGLTPLNLIYLAGIGLIAAVFDVFLAATLNGFGGKTFALPLIYGSALLVSYICGILFLGDETSIFEIASLGLILAGLGLLTYFRFIK